MKSLSLLSKLVLPLSLPVFLFCLPIRSMEIDEHSHPRWELMWNQGLKPGQAFDKFIPSPILQKYNNENKIPDGLALVPGCGRGYDVTYLASKDRKVVGLELSSTAVEAAKNRLSQIVESEGFLHQDQCDFRNQNFFDLNKYSDQPKELYDFVYDYTFFCALDPSIRSNWAKQMANVIKPGGLLMTVIFPIIEKVGGPPFGVSLDAYKNVLEPAGFECLELDILPPELSHADRDGGPDGKGPKSGIGLWKRKGENDKDL